jgi:hypothetical protein
MFGFGTIGLESSEIGSSTLTSMPKEETLVVNKDLSNILKFQGGGQQNICFCHNRFGVRRRIDENQRKKCLNLKFTRGFSGTIKDGVQKN